MSSSVDAQLAAATRDYNRVIGCINSCNSELGSLRNERNTYASRRDAVSRIRSQMSSAFDTSGIRAAQTGAHSYLESGVSGPSHKGQIASAIQGDYEKSVASDSKMSESLSLLASEINRLQRLVDSSDSSIRSCENRISSYESQKWSLRSRIIRLKTQKALG